MSAISKAGAVGTDEQFAAVQRAMESVVRRIPHLHRQVVARTGTTLDRASLTVLDQIALLGPVRPSAVADALMVDLSLVSRQLQILERQGLVRRQPDTSDGRAAVITVTRKGGATVRRIRAVWLALVAEAFAGWDPAELRSFTGMLTRYAAELQRISRPGLELERPGSERRRAR